MLERHLAREPTAERVRSAMLQSSLGSLSMDSAISRWGLLGSSTNEYGVTHFTLYCRDVTAPDGDYEELIRVLKCEFGAVEQGELVGPYSVHKYLDVGGLRMGLILDDVDSLDLYA